MMDDMIGQIELNEAEQELANKIVFDLERYVRLERPEVIANGEMAAALLHSLMDRKAILTVRWRWFTDPEYNPGQSKGSRADIFLRKARTAEQMYRHGDFALNYLRYFVY